MPRNLRASRRWSTEFVGRCRDEAGRRRKLLVVLTSEGRLAVVAPPGGIAVLNVILAGQLRAALREAAFALDDPNIERPHAFPVPIEGFHLDGLDERAHRPAWLSRLFCHRVRPADVGCDNAKHNDAPTSAGIQQVQGRRTA
jgi:hypothetical protein